MPQPIRVLHFADVHIGMENYGRTDPETGLSSRVVDFLRALDAMIDHARKRDVDLVIFAGDAFKTSTPNPTYQREFALRVQDLAALAPTVLLIGNHDLTPNAQKATSVDIYDTLAVPNVWVAEDYEVRTLDTKRGPISVATAPYPVRSRLMQALDTRGKSIKEIDTLLEGTLTSILDDLAAEAEAAGADVPRLLTAHFTVRGAIFGSERNAMLGRDVQVSLGLLADPRWDYVALGHIHQFQDLTAKQDGVPPVVYSGSLERVDFGEEGDTKGFCWLEIQRGQVTWDFVPVAARRMVTLSVDCRTERAPTEAVIKRIKAHDLHGAIVRVFVRLTPETEAVLNDGDIFAALRKAGAFHIAGIRRDVERPERSRLGTNPEGLTHLELLERYLIAREIAPERRAALLEAAAAIMHDEDDA